MRNKVNFPTTFFFGFFFLIFGSNMNLAHAQCNSKISVEAKSINDTKGEITVKITTSESFVCRLNSLSGKGTETLDSKSDRGNKTIKFSDLDKNKIYQVEVEFLTETHVLCKKLQKNNLIFEP